MGMGTQAVTQCTTVVPVTLLGLRRLPVSLALQRLRCYSPFLLIKYRVMLFIEQEGGRYDLGLPDSTHI